MSERSRNGRFGRVGRRPDHWASQHERARVRAAERLEEPLPAGEESWLESHLAACEPCRAIAEAYATERLALRQLRAERAEPPRDLWANDLPATTTTQKNVFQRQHGEGVDSEF